MTGTRRCYLTRRTVSVDEPPRRSPRHLTRQQHNRRPQMVTPCVRIDHNTDILNKAHIVVMDIPSLDMRNPQPNVVPEQSKKRPRNETDQLHEGNPTAESSKLRRGRKRCIKLQRSGCNERESIAFNAQGKVCSANTTKFANWCGCIVCKRTNVPLQLKDWKDLKKEPIDFEEKMLTVVAEKFIIPEDDYRRQIILGMLRDKYRHYRANLKKKLFRQLQYV